MSKDNGAVPEIDPSELIFEKCIGEGTYGTVWAGKCRGKEVAIKVFKRKDDVLSDAELEKFREEVKIMSKIPHPNVVLFMGACTKRGKDLMLITDLLPADMESLLVKDKKEFTLFQKMLMARDAALGMNWLHCSDPIFIHRDLKLSNLLVTNQKRVCVCDFGLAQMKPKSQANLDYDPHGSPIYMAPEVFTGEYNEKCDIYSFGVCLWEIVMQSQAFSDMEDDLPAFIHAICDLDKRPPIPQNVPKRLQKMMAACWNKKPSLRPSFKELLDEIDKLLIELAIEDDCGRKMWRKYFLGRLEVTWEEFPIVLLKTMHVENPDSEIIEDYLESLGKVLAETSQAITGTDMIISMLNFGKILSYFGPLKLDKTSRKEDLIFLQRVHNFTSEKWFHGNIDQVEAAKRLSSGKSGEFLVRFSQTPGYFTVSHRGKDKQIYHSRVRYVPGEGFQFANKYFEDFNALLRAEGKKQSWKKPCSYAEPDQTQNNYTTNDNNV